jgi:hypothetical protein
MIDFKKILTAQSFRREAPGFVLTITGVISVPDGFVVVYNEQVARDGEIQIQCYMAFITPNGRIPTIALASN